MLTATGNPDTNDADRFRYDPVLLVALGLDVDGVRTAVLHLKRQFLDFSILSTLKASISSQIGFWSFTLRHKKKPKRLYLYADGTAVETFGTQEGSVYRGGKYGKEMYFPLTYI